MHVARQLLERGDEVLGIDDLNDYYDPALKLARLEQLKAFSNFSFIQCDISDQDHLNNIFSDFKPKKVVHLAAQAGVRYSLINPLAYGKSNLSGFLNILEASRTHQLAHLVFASSSSVYGNSNRLPLSEDQIIAKPISLYAATKASNELMAYSYSHLYGLKVTGLRYFTVYGPWGRPDMAPWIFTSKLLKGDPITVFNHGDMIRDFTYIDDAAEATVRLLDADLKEGYNLVNIGHAHPEKLMDFIGALEKSLTCKAKINFEKIQEGDVASTHADTQKLQSLIDFKPSIAITEGVLAWVNWYRGYVKK